MEECITGTAERAAGYEHSGGVRANQRGATLNVSNECLKHGSPLRRSTLGPKTQPHAVKSVHVAGASRPWARWLDDTVNARATLRERNSTLP